MIGSIARHKRTRVQGVLFSFAAVLLCACSSVGIKHVSGEEFQSRAREFAGANTDYMVRYIGVSSSRAYLERTLIYPSYNGRTVVMWTRLSELPVELASQLKAGEDPWALGRLELSPVTMDDFVGEYGAGSTHLEWLKLDRNGEFQCFISNGSVDGCLTVRGAGMSQGVWTVKGGVLSFYSVREPSDLVLSLKGATAVLYEGGVIVTAGGAEHRLIRGPYAWFR